MLQSEKGQKESKDFSALITICFSSKKRPILCYDAAEFSHTKTFWNINMQKEDFLWTSFGRQGPFDSFLPLLIDKGSKLILYIQA